MWTLSVSFNWRSADTQYAKQNGGAYNFIVEDTGALPVDQVFYTVIRWYKKSEINC